MIYRFSIISNEVEDFIREIKIDSDATFFDLQEAILAACQYDNKQITSFFTCSDRWEKEQEILMEDLGYGRADEDIYLMKDTRLSELLEDEKQRMVFIFDPLEERMFLIELTEIIFGKTQSNAVCSRQHGLPPQQYIEISEPIPPTPTKKAEDLQEDFYGSDDFDNEEFDPEGFEISEGNPYS